MLHKVVMQVSTRRGEWHCGKGVPTFHIEADNLDQAQAIIQHLVDALVCADANEVTTHTGIVSESGDYVSHTYRAV